MTLRSLTAAALVAVGLVGTAAAPALAQGSRSVTVMGMTFEQPAGASQTVRGYEDGRVQAR